LENNIRKRTLAIFGVI